VAAGDIVVYGTASNVTFDFNVAAISAVTGQAIWSTFVSRFFYNLPGISVVIGSDRMVVVNAGGYFFGIGGAGCLSAARGVCAAALCSWCALR
jgi:outer membrane protein assembly factor BamB